MTPRRRTDKSTPPKLGGVPASHREQAGWFRNLPAAHLTSFGRGTPPNLGGEFLFLCVSFLILFIVLPAPAQPTWAFNGPTGTGTRIIALASDPRDGSVAYAAAGSAGMWKTQDNDQTWASLLNSELSQQVCSIAIDPRSPDVMYLGTGDDQSPRLRQG